MKLDALPVFRDLPADEIAYFRAQANPRQLAAGEVVFYQGDAVAALFVLAAGSCTVERDGVWRVTVSAPALLDPVATCGGLVHGEKVTAAADCELLAWPMELLSQSGNFAAAARRYLAAELQQAQDRLSVLEAPVHYQPTTAQPLPGPFLFNDVTMIFAFCDADLTPLRATLPDGVSLIRRPGRKRDSVLLALADFPNAYPEDDPGARFAYTETTVFVPVRFRRRIGFFVPYIYPSAWEPVVLGREIYGFPKRLGRTNLDLKHAALRVDGAQHLDLRWEGLETTDETRLVRALVDWMGLAGWGAALAFRAGEVLRSAMQLPPHRRVAVYNHKRILAPNATYDNPTYQVDCLTHAIFGVLRWYQVARMDDAQLDIHAGPLRGANMTLREAFRTQLDMRLSAGRVVRDYAAKTEGNQVD
ncbi:MAG: hypothetical protein GYB65_13420 [Chloroflexi bacterium]|nr:hypothetical protein [Chloroflexota bacterium]